MDLEFDAIENFAFGTVLTAPSPAASGTSLVLQAGEGALFPAPATDGEYNLTVWPDGVQPTTTNAEIVRVTARSSDTFTITREQEDSNARTIVAGDRVALSITKKRFTDIQTAITGLERATIAGAYTSSVMYIAHRNAPNLLPEHTMEGFRAIVAAGVKAIEADVYLLADGSLGIMHDTTLTRTTTSGGNTADQTAMSWAALVNDHGATLGGLYTSKTYQVPTLDEFLREFGNEVVLIIEGKNTGACAAIVDKLQKYSIATDAVIVQSATLSELSSVVSAGYPALVLGDALTPSTVSAAGVGYVGVSTAATSVYIASLIAEGLEVFAYTVDRQSIRDTFTGYGVTGFFSDDPIYLTGTGYRKTTDPFVTQHFYHGHLADSTFSQRGTFNNTDRWEIANADRAYILQGWGSPVGGTAGNTGFTITFSIRFTTLTATRWGGIAIMDKDHDFAEAAVTGQNGYHFLFRTEGTLQIYKITDGVATQLGSDTATAALATNTTYNMTLTVTPTSLSWARSGFGAATSNDTTYRGGYFYFTHRVNPAQFFDVTVTDT